VKGFCKRLFDLIFSICCLLPSVVLFVVIAVSIKLSDKGPVIFRQLRIGKNGKPFALLKFRTMKTGVDPFAQSPKTGEDPRVIKPGKFLRNYSLDELPQFFNVLKGDMSIVGPRPLYLSQVREMDNYHRRRLFVRPGITGISQISLRSELTSKKSLDLEVEYVDKQNFWVDMNILLRTLLAVLGKKGVYEK
jgi:lipopolysaccharide/colanic/teichoic acid biosynthesis glycosyltransferase